VSETYGEVDPRVVTTVPMSPGLWYAFGENGVGTSQLQNPFVLAGELDNILGWKREAKPTWEAMAGPKRLALFNTVGHYGFSFLCEILPNIQPECVGPEGGWAELSWVHERSQTLVMAHLGLIMLHDERYAPWLEETEDVEWNDITMEFIP